jgi:hypothetical protein
MVESEDKAAASATGQLPYRIEIWDSATGRVERVLARAAGAQLARAIFAAVRVEYPGRRIILARGGRELARSA